MQHDANLIGKKVGRLRYAKSWTQEVLAAKLQILQCDVSREVIANIENRRSVVGLTRNDGHLGRDALQEKRI